MNAAIRLENISCRYQESASGKPVEALSVRFLDVAPGEIMAVSGPNGSGKSTLLETISFLRQPEEGRVLVDGWDPRRENRLLEARQRIPILLQKTVLFSMTVAANVAYGLKIRKIPPAETARRVAAALETIGMERLSHRRHNELSFGEKRRVALARILVLDAPVMVLDEPFAGVDPESANLAREAIRHANLELGTTVMLSCHNPGEASSLTARIVNISGGKLA